jgi:hypothetical protein
MTEIMGTSFERSQELVQLHYEVKARHANGQVDDAFREARNKVAQVLRELASEVIAEQDSSIMNDRIV